MKVRYIDTCELYGLIKQKEYKVEQETMFAYHIINENCDLMAYSKSKFETVKEHTMKISKWEDLKWVKVGERYINWNLYGIEITDTHKCRINYLYITNYTKEELIGIIKVIGLDIEFEPEITITQKEFDFLNCLEYPSDKSVDKYMGQPRIIYSREELNTHPIHIKDNMFKFINKGDVYPVSNLLKMKVSG